MLKRTVVNPRFGFIFLTSAAIAISLGACSKSDGGGTDTRLVTDFSSCDQKPDVGTSAIAGNASKTEWSTTYFEKAYDHFDLDAVLDASSTSTTQYVQSLGIGVYKIPRADMKGLCPTYFNLSVAPRTFQDIWKQVAGGGTGQGSLAGLFFEFCGPGSGAACLERQMVQPTILLDEASDRWTIVHEMMHHNFNQGRKADLARKTTNELNQALRNESANLKAALADYKALPNRGDLQHAADAFRVISEVGTLIAEQRMLEEMTIEAMLIDQWVAGDLKNVSDRAPDSGVWYMGYSFEQFEKMLLDLNPIEQQIQSEADAHFWTEITDHVKTSQQIVDDVRTEAKTMIEAAKRKIRAVKNMKDDREFLDAPIRFGKGPLATTDKKSKASTTVAMTPAEREAALQKAREVAKAHLDSHDDAGLANSFAATTHDIATHLPKAKR